MAYRRGQMEPSFGRVERTGQFAYMIDSRERGYSTLTEARTPAQRIERRLTEAEEVRREEQARRAAEFRERRTRERAQAGTAEAYEYRERETGRPGYRPIPGRYVRIEYGFQRAPSLPGPREPMGLGAIREQEVIQRLRYEVEELPLGEKPDWRQLELRRRPELIGFPPRPFTRRPWEGE